MAGSPELDLTPHFSLRGLVQKVALDKAAEDGVITKEDMELCSPATTDTAMATMAVYECVVCKSPYCGGKVDCAEEMVVDPALLFCHSCRWEVAMRTQDTKGNRCREHGPKYVARSAPPYACTVDQSSSTNNHRPKWVSPIYRPICVADTMTWPNWSGPWGHWARHAMMQW